MKNLKNYAMALVALVIAISSLTLISFKSNKTTPESQWFMHNGTDPSDPSQYEPLNSGSPECLVGTRVCAIKTNPSSSNPDEPDQTELNVILSQSTSSSFDSNEIRYKP